LRRGAKFIYIHTYIFLGAKHISLYMYTCICIFIGYPFETWCKVMGVEWDQDANGDFIQPTPFNGSFDNSLVPRGYFDRCVRVCVGGGVGGGGGGKGRNGLTNWLYKQILRNE